MCAIDGRFIAETSCSNVSDSSKIKNILLLVLVPIVLKIISNNNNINLKLQFFAVVKYFLFVINHLFVFV
jgi:hypothetical protein